MDNTPFIVSKRIENNDPDLEIELYIALLILFLLRFSLMEAMLRSSFVL